MNHMSICNKSGIFIYYQPRDNFSGRIAIKRKDGKIELSNNVYKDQSVKFSKNDLKYWEDIYKMYSYEYEVLCSKYKSLATYKEKIEVELEILIVK